MKTLLTPHRLGLAVLIASFAAGAARSAESAANFLTITPSPIYSALGVRGTAMISDVDAVFLNPGGLGQMNASQLSAAHTELFSDSTYDAFGAAHKLSNNRGTLAVGVIYLKKGSIQGRNELGQETGGFSADDLAFNIGYGRSLTNRLVLGSTVKMVRQRIDHYSATAAALDVGMQMAATNRIRVGASLNNLGTQMKFISKEEPLPLSANLGLVYKLGLLDLMAESSSRIHESRTQFGLGIGYQVASSLSLRSGYTFGQALASAGSISSNDQFGDFAGFSAGLGFALKRFNLDYALVPHQELPASHQFSLKVSY